MKISKRENGQAITEFVVCLLGIIFVFLGLLAISILSMENVRSVLTARGEVDVSSGQGSTIGGQAPQPIVEWDRGKDKIPFTADDTPVTGSQDSYIFQFDTTNGTLTDGAPAPRPPQDRELLYINPVNLYQLEDRGYASAQAANSTFLDAADLNGATNTVRDPLSKHGLPDLEKIIRAFLGNVTFKLQDSVYMPARVD